ncbi:MAG TPA: transposase [Candidatus Deferrimicrobium sp.]|nr:transposase [Candidatus Deferrimicrobium sp.]
MKYNAEIHHRRSIRLQGYDYSSAGAYFVTLCTQNHECLFGEISNRKMILNAAGEMINIILQQIPDFYPDNDIDEFVVMPDHIHTIIIVGAGPRVCPSVFASTGNPQGGIGQPRGVSPTGLPLPDMVSRIKSMTTKLYSDGVKQSGWQPFNGKLWQRNYYEHIIRNENELFQIREYVDNNPANWEIDAPGQPVF